MLKPLTLWIAGGVVALVFAPLIWTVNRAPSDGEARQMLTAAVSQNRTLTALSGTGDRVMLETTHIARIDSAICQPDPDARVFGRAQFGASRRQSICHYQIATPEGAVFALVLRASRENAGPADRPSGNPLVDGSRRFTGAFRWSPVSMDEGARLLSGRDR